MLKCCVVRFVGSYYVNVGVCSLNRRSWILDNGLLRRPLVLVRLGNNDGLLVFSYFLVPV